MAMHFALRFKTSPDDLKKGAIIYMLDPHWLIDFILVRELDEFVVSQSSEGS
jgi:hypothetical protein